MSKAFELFDVIKQFNQFRLGPVKLDLEPGMVLGFVGPNGAGKTTTMQCIMGFHKLTAGRIEVFGQENSLTQPEWKQNIGFVGDKHAYYEKWTVDKNLKFLSQFYPNWSNSLMMSLVNRFELPLKKKVKELSTGNRVKLALIAALSHSPKLLILDEPTSGLDPIIRSELLDILFEVLEGGDRAIFYSTHILSDISRLVDDLAFISGGQIIRRISKDDLLDHWRRISFRSDRENIKHQTFVQVMKDGADHQVTTSNQETAISFLKEIGAEIHQNNRMTLEEIAVYLLKSDRLMNGFIAE